MCLGIIERTYSENKMKGFGYKIVFKESDGYRTIYQDSYLTSDFWNKAESLIIVNADEGKGTYFTGYHFYMKLKDAKIKLINLKDFYTRKELKHLEFKIIKIKYKNLTAKGKERVKFGFGDVRVAKEIRFIKEVK